MNRYSRLILLLTALSCYLSASGQKKMFESLASKNTGIAFSNDISETENLNVLAYEYFYNGGGVAVGDINNDGLEDLFFTANMKPNRLYLNLGDLKFRDITKAAGAGLEGRKNSWKTGTTIADVNGDGLLDIYLCYSGKVADENRRNQLFINKGNLKFDEAAKQYGLDDKSYSTQAAFFDFDNDGDLDMFLLNHSTKKIDNMELARHRNLIDSLAGNKLYRNDGAHFTDVSKSAGIYQSPLNFGLGLAIADINKDGWQDIYASNDYNEPDYLYINNHNGTFTESSEKYFNHLAQFSMGVDIADFNNDGLPDVLNMDMMPEDNKRQKLLQLQENYESFQLMLNQGLQKQYMRNMLQLNNGNGTFSEIAQLSGLSNTDWSWAPLFADFDNDGYKDVFVTNGYLRDYTNKDFLKYWGDYKVKKAIDREPAKLMDLITAMPSTKVHNYIFRNNKDRTFKNTVEEWGLQTPDISSGAVYVDLDNDGDLDLVVNRINEDAAIYRNNSSEISGNNFLSVKLEFKTPNLNAIGSKIYLYTKQGLQYLEVNPNRGYLSCVSTTAHFGIGQEKVIDSVLVIWPDKTQQKVTTPAINSLVKITYKSTVSVPPATKKNIVFEKSPAFINYTNQSNRENDFKRQPLLLYMYSKTGPVMAKGDVNKDGLTDIFISGDQSEPAKIFLQQKDGSFKPVPQNISDEAASTISAAVFFDSDNDGDPDLYMAKGGYSLFEANTPSLQDELYLNDGKGNFSRSVTTLPDVSAGSKSCVRPCDYNGDGKIDLFVGARVVPGQYPVIPDSYLLTNRGNNTFEITPSSFSKVGMVTDAAWTDINKDGKPDLILCGEFMPISIFINNGSEFIDSTDTYFTDDNKGLWQTLTIADINNDGEDDIIAGNLGRNIQFHFSEKEPLELYYADFDNNGSVDPFLNCYVQGISYPFVSRDELNDQIYGMRKKFTSYKSYADATIKDIFSPEELAKANKLSATEPNSVYFIKKGPRYEKNVLPVEAQFSMVTKVLTGDFNRDGRQDLLLLGNHSDNRLKIGAIDANFGCLLIGMGTGEFSYVNQSESGLNVIGDVKSADTFPINDKNYVVVGVADGELQFYNYK
ncbi:VCBS repeat-containing protein [Rubrolithibacter danxiaensis]|uniref:VCBS repeat-containing protein n=1 Tax=Rubrolithibacter danxiaensis TaxID=3390805 RepID=UPI003BF7E4C0